MISEAGKSHVLVHEVAHVTRRAMLVFVACSCMTETEISSVLVPAFFLFLSWFDI